MEMNAHYKDFTDELASLIDSQDYFPPPPSSYHFNGPNPRQTPSPPQHHQQHHQQPYQLASRSRSRSRPPSVTENANTGSIGPARRTRRTNSVSGTSPPPYARPHAIVIPATRPGNGSGWFSQSSASEFSLATPSDLGPHQQSPLSYSSFSIPDPQQKSNSIEFSLYHPQGSPPTSAYPYTPSSSVPLTVPNHHHPGTNANSLAGALSASLPIHSPVIQHPTSPGSTGTLAGPFGIPPPGLPPYTVGPPSNPSPTSPASATVTHPHPHHPPPTAIPTAALSPQDKQALIANEKRRRRRESHNAVERRRRDNINEKITELATLIPECMLEGGIVAPLNNTGSVSPSAEDHSSYLDGADPLFPLSGTKIEDTIKEEGDPTASTPATGASAEGGVVKANKGMILRKSVEYIRYLQQLVTAQGARNRELEQELKAYRSGNSPTLNPNSNSSPTSSGPPIPALGSAESSSTLTLNANDANACVKVNGRRRQNAERSNKSIKRNRHPKVSSPSDQSGEGDLDEKDLPLLPDEHDREDHEHEPDESSDPDVEYEGENGQFGGMLGGMAGMSGMVLADEGMRLEFPGAQHPQATQTPVAGARGRRARRTSSTSLGNSARASRQPIHPSHQQHPHTMQNVQAMNVNMNMNLAMFPDGLGMSVPVSIPAGMATDMSMEVDACEHPQATIERGRTSTRPGTSSGPVELTQKRSFVGNARANGLANGNCVAGSPNGIRLKEEMADVAAGLGLGSSMGMGMGLLPMGMSA